MGFLMKLLFLVACVGQAFGQKWTIRPMWFTQVDPIYELKDLPPTMTVAQLKRKLGAYTHESVKDDDGNLLPVFGRPLQEFNQVMNLRKSDGGAVLEDQKTLRESGLGNNAKITVHGFSFLDYTISVTYQESLNSDAGNPKELTVNALMTLGDFKTMVRAEFKLPKGIALDMISNGVKLDGDEAKNLLGLGMIKNSMVRFAKAGAQAREYAQDNAYDYYSDQQWERQELEQEIAQLTRMLRNGNGRRSGRTQTRQKRYRGRSGRYQ